jgi:hypothetical protein
MLARSEHSAVEVASFTAVAENGNVRSVDSGSPGDVEGRFGVVFDGNNFVDSERVTVKRIVDGGGCC